MVVKEEGKVMGVWVNVEGRRILGGDEGGWKELMVGEVVVWNKNEMR